MSKMELPKLDNDGYNPPEAYNGHIVITSTDNKFALVVPYAPNLRIFNLRDHQGEVYIPFQDDVIAFRTKEGKIECCVGINSSYNWHDISSPCECNDPLKSLRFAVHEEILFMMSNTTLWMIHPLTGDIYVYDSGSIKLEDNEKYISISTSPNYLWITTSNNNLYRMNLIEFKSSISDSNNVIAMSNPEKLTFPKLEIRRPNMKDDMISLLDMLSIFNPKIGILVLSEYNISLAPVYMDTEIYIQPFLDKGMIIGWEDRDGSQLLIFNDILTSGDRNITFDSKWIPCKLDKVAITTAYVSYINNGYLVVEPLVQ